MLSDEISVEIPDISKDRKAIDALDLYIRIGDILSNEPSPESLNLESQVGKDTAGQFISIVVPTLSGKTQSAFTIRSKRPLYFTFDVHDKICKNFSVLTKKLMEYAQDDRKSMKRYLLENALIKREADPKNPKGSSYDYIAIDELRHVSGMKSKTLGFFMALIQDGETRFQGPNWMKHYSSPRKLTIEPISIADFLNHPNHRTYIKRYFIFLDEFHGDFDLIFVRNLCRYVNLTCLMTTSSNIGDINIMSREEASKYTKNRFM